MGYSRSTPSIGITFLVTSSSAIRTAAPTQIAGSVADRLLEPGARGRRTAP